MNVPLATYVYSVALCKTPVKTKHVVDAHGYTQQNGLSDHTNA